MTEDWANYDRRIKPGASVRVHEVSGPTPGVYMGFGGAAGSADRAAKRGHPLVAIVRAVRRLPCAADVDWTVWAEIAIADLAGCYDGGFPLWDECGWPARDLEYVDSDGGAYAAKVRQVRREGLWREVKRGGCALRELLATFLTRRGKR